MKLMLSLFLRVPVVSTLVHGAAAAVLAPAPRHRERRLRPTALVSPSPRTVAGQPRRRRELRTAARHGHGSATTGLTS